VRWHPYCKHMCRDAYGQGERYRLARGAAPNGRKVEIVTAALEPGPRQSPREDRWFFQERPFKACEVHGVGPSAIAARKPIVPRSMGGDSARRPIYCSDRSC
jgi:hypothetical protein